MSLSDRELDKTKPDRSNRLCNLGDTIPRELSYRTTDATNSGSMNSSLNHSSSIPVCLTKNEEYNTNDSYYESYDPNVSLQLENMFPPYVRLFSDDETEEDWPSNNTKGVYRVRKNANRLAQF